MRFKPKYRLNNQQIISDQEENYESLTGFDLDRLVDDRIILLSGEITSDVATEKVAQLLWLNQRDPNAEITMYINSTGGYILDGLLTVYDTMQYIKAPIKTIVIGVAYSSAAILLAAGTKGSRFAYPSARLLVHGIQIDEMAGTTQKEIEEEVKRMKQLNKFLMQIIARHTGQTLRKVTKDCATDKYFTAEEAIKYGLVDNIVSSSKHIPDLITKKTNNIVLS